MKAAYPPSTNIYGRFDNTQQIDVHLGNVSQQGDTATADVTLAARNTDGTVTGYVGSWNLVRGPSGWLLDSVSLSPAHLSGADGTQQKVPDKGKHAGNAGNQGNG
jgi:hypothetical protein